MADMTVPYDRRFTDAKSNAVVSRATNTQNVLRAMKDTAPSLPRFPRAQYEANTEELQNLNVEVGDLLTTLINKLQRIDTLAENVKAASAAYLPTMKGILMGTANENLLNQITGPHHRDDSDPKPTPTPTTP